MGELTSRYTDNESSQMSFGAMINFLRKSHIKLKREVKMYQRSRDPIGWMRNSLEQIILGRPMNFLLVAEVI